VSLSCDQNQEPNPRIAVRLRARISTIDPETDPFTGKLFFRASDETCANVSRNGVFVSMRETIPPGRRLLVELEIPGGQQVQAVGRVAWTRTTLMAADPAGKNRESGIGIQFLAGRQDNLEALEQFVKRTIRQRRIAPDAAGSLTPTPQS
jgi:Tfp pilus assembly protein PilZ